MAENQVTKISGREKEANFLYIVLLEKKSQIERKAVLRYRDMVTSRREKG
jgi:hypothetical protein